MKSTMRSSVTSNLVLAGLCAGLASVYGCSSGGGSNGTGFTGAAGTNGTGAAGSSATGAAGSSAAAGTNGAAGTGGGADITKVVRTPGCGMDPGQALGKLVGPQHIVTSGTKAPTCADTKCGSWTYTRDYWVQLPANYDKTKAYPLLFEGPGCGGHGDGLYALPGLANSIIRVGVSPSADAQAFHATNPGQGCFDDKEGDDSVDWPLYEALWDKLATTLCFDKNRVFAGGNSSGAWFANELGCKYAGDPVHPIRGIMPNTGGLPMDARYEPTCTNKPLAGFWSHETGDPTNPFTGNIFAMNRALPLDGCAAGTTYTTATFTPFMISATDSTSCKKYSGCSPLYPMVVCPLPGNSHGGHDSVVNPGWATFINLFSTGALISQ